MRSKTILALAFASGLIYPQVPAHSQNAPEPKFKYAAKLVIKDFVTDSQGPAELKAYNLLLIARRLLDGADLGTVSSEFSGTAFSNETWNGEQRRRFLNLLAAEQAAKTVDGSSKCEGAEERLLANSALEAAIKQLDQSKEPYSRLVMLFITSSMYQRLGDTSGAQQCNTFINKYLSAVKSASSPSVDQISAAIHVLELQAFQKIQLEIPEYLPQPLPRLETYSKADYIAAEKLRLEAVLIADKLPASEHVRRKAHRDLALWYTALGKEIQAEKEKQVLYTLVGFKNESLLNPQVAGCGSLAWWLQKPLEMTYDCGRG